MTAAIEPQTEAPTCKDWCEGLAEGESREGHLCESAEIELAFSLGIDEDGETVVYTDDPLPTRRQGFALLQLVLASFHHATEVAEAEAS